MLGGGQSGSWDQGRGLPDPQPRRTGQSRCKGAEGPSRHRAGRARGQGLGRLQTGKTEAGGAETAGASSRPPAA